MCSVVVDITAVVVLLSDNEDVVIKEIVAVEEAEVENKVVVFAFEVVDVDKEVVVEEVIVVVADAEVAAVVVADAEVAVVFVVAEFCFAAAVGVA